MGLLCPHPASLCDVWDGRMIIEDSHLLGFLLFNDRGVWWVHLAFDIWPILVILRVATIWVDKLSTDSPNFEPITGNDAILSGEGSSSDKTSISTGDTELFTLIKSRWEKKYAPQNNKCKASEMQSYRSGVTGDGVFRRRRVQRGSQRVPRRTKVAHAVVWSAL